MKKLERRRKGREKINVPLYAGILEYSLFLYAWDTARILVNLLEIAYTYLQGGPK